MPCNLLILHDIFLVMTGETAFQSRQTHAVVTAMWFASHQHKPHLQVIEQHGLPNGPPNDRTDGYGFPLSTSQG
jgi:hypothetical protein